MKTTSLNQFETSSDKNNFSEKNAKKISLERAKTASSSKHLLASIWDSPLGKVTIVGVGLVTMLAASGGLFRLLAWTTTGYKDFNSARNRK